MEFFPVPDERIRVTHLGVSSKFFKKYSESEINQFRAKHGLVKPVILYTGSLKPHKNVKVLISAFANLNRRSDYQLVIIGESIKRNRELWRLITQKGLTDEIIDIGQIDSNDLPRAYQASSVAVLPSLYEGFGFSIIEAMASGTPAVGANAGSIPEVMGNGGILFDPRSVDALTETLEMVLTDSRLHGQLVQRGFENAAKYSWEKCTEETLKVYKDVI